jgi:hypothetical protein
MAHANNRHNVGGMFVSGDETGIAHLKKLDSSETDVLFRNVQEMGEAAFESYRGDKFIIIRNADYTMLVERAVSDDPRWV